MIPETNSKGIVLYCDQQGGVRRVIWDSLGITASLKEGDSFVRVVDRGSIQKVLDFFLEVRTVGTALDWEVNVTVDGQILILHLASFTVNEQLLVVGAPTSAALLSLYDEMMRINNEQVNALRALMKETPSLSEGREEDAGFFEELSRLNNELVALQRELVKKNVELERLNAQKNRFLGMAAHDLRSPLWVIAGFSEALLEELAEDLTPQQREILTVIHDSSQFMRHLVEDLLDVARIESGQLSLRPAPTDVVELAKRNVELNRVLAARKGIEIVTHLPDKTPTLIVDPGKVEQVLNNLISNAVKYSHPDTVVEVALTKDEDRVVLSVRDEGQGIPEGELHHLFQPFGTTSVEATDGERSTGLGLMIVKKIVEGHGGEIWVESAVGEGSTFYVALPVKEEARVFDS